MAEVFSNFRAITVGAINASGTRVEGFAAQQRITHWRLYRQERLGPTQASPIPYGGAVELASPITVPAGQRARFGQGDLRVKINTGQSSTHQATRDIMKGVFAEGTDSGHRYVVALLTSATQEVTDTNYRREVVGLWQVASEADSS